MSTLSERREAFIRAAAHAVIAIFDSTKATSVSRMAKELGVSEDATFKEAEDAIRALFAIEPEDSVPKNDRCTCGHSRSMHDLITGRCTVAFLSNPLQLCDCTAFRLSTTNQTGGEPLTGQTFTNPASNAASAVQPDAAAETDIQMIIEDYEAGFPRDEGVQELVEIAKTLESKLAAVTKERDEALVWKQSTERILHDATAVHVNMLRGSIATPSKAQLLHVLGDQGLSSAEAERDQLRERVKTLEQLQSAAEFVSRQCTECGKCGVRKHTPWRDDEYGYVCATCFDAIHAEAESRLRALITEKLLPALEHFYHIKRECPADSSGKYWLASEDGAIIDAALAEAKEVLK